MKKTLITGLAVALSGLAASADITVKVSPEANVNEFDVEYGYLSDMVNPGPDSKAPVKEHKTATDGTFTIPTLSEGTAQYVIPVGEREYVMLYTNPGDDLTVDITSIAPLDYTITGSKMMTDIADLDSRSGKILDVFRALSATGAPDTGAIEKLRTEYDKIFTDYIAANPDSEAVPYAILHLEGEDFINAYNGMTTSAAKSPLAVFLAPQLERVEKQMAAERRKAELTSGNVMAPDFTFNDVEGKPVSLSSFLGKWVVIDFWGSWCPWCIKGFPELKEAYKEYKPELEIIGVACNDEYSAWEAALKKYDLPWVNVYNPEKKGGQLLVDYAVEGFPTKAIISPEGVIVNITVGHNPDFFNILREKMGKSVSK